MEGLDVVEAQFRRSLDDGEIEHHRVGKTVDGYKAMELSNRYVTWKDSTSGAEEVELGDDVDPRGFLSKLMGEKYVRTEENVVVYYELVQDGDDNAERYIECSPKRFKKGDIVEAQFSLSCVSLGQRNGNKWRMVGILRSLTLLDGKFTEDAIKAEKESLKGQADERGGLKKGSRMGISAPSLKRRVGHARYSNSMTGTGDVEGTATTGGGDVIFAEAKEKVD
ncbi:hypothetical protein AAF712_014602 [Marasmius tenuissimus]|uniref:Uncharacterized protein n=1 Tax=Marasmius tenuissimus TaxID=585030 RepID=A0ABR2ZCL1_9AGAR